MCLIVYFMESYIESWAKKCVMRGSSEIKWVLINLNLNKMYTAETFCCYKKTFWKIAHFIIII